MADNDALRSRRKRLHAAGDCSLCRHPPKTPTLTMVTGEGELDRDTELQALAHRLITAHQADPGNGILARELRATLAMLPATATAASDDTDTRIRLAMERQTGWSADGDPEALDLQMAIAADNPMAFLRALANQVP